MLTLSSSSTIFNSPPTSHFIAMVESLHDLLEKCESEVEESSSSSPGVILMAVYMVNTDHGGGEVSHA